MPRPSSLPVNVARRRTLRRIAWILLAVVLVAVGVSAALVFPRVEALEFLRAIARPAPESGVLPQGTHTVADETLGPPRVRFLTGEGAKARPGIVIVHGVTEKGVDDGRLLGLAAAFREAGFAVVLPEISGLVKMPADGKDGDRLATLLHGLAKGRLADVDPSRFALFGVSVGGPLALSAAARFRKEGGQGLRAICLVGAPDDIRRSVRAWFAEQPAPPTAPPGTRERAKSAEFARSMVHRAGLDAAVPEEDRAAVRTWLESAWTPVGGPPALRTAEARELVLRVRRGPAGTEADVEGATEAAWPTLRALSPAHAGTDYEALRGVPVFLVHGVEDPLVPISEMPLLAERLRAHTDVRTLRSTLLGHVEVGSQEAWDHVLYLDDFFDLLTD